ncbi:hypothetical protein VHEMI00161 [[Torrubiella] hemipterigena]|uniref:Ubiquitin-activating enzyme E1-like n=1 Tax=[Torrubiella] hemipterigena TaxID=1531966 RepID=A0A0A1T1F3_9HYPO|nr:hypothetical protein VHEMI00161 [[Torrubiella] hemipterigena]
MVHAMDPSNDQAKLPAEEAAQAQRPTENTTNESINKQENGTAADVATISESTKTTETPVLGSTQSQKPPTTQAQPVTMTRDHYNFHSLGISLNTAVKKARVLMVGAGGIGCELLKNLVLSGFGDIHIVDLDTIDLSNLNRQFLFRHEHIKKSKALVAKEAALIFNPQVNITAHHANIKDSEFTVSWFRQFGIVFNALDNLDARRHVNRMCLAADVPLIESGTTGFNGQVQVIKKGQTACYDCTPKEVPKSFPVCTIRSTPSQPIHCIVWGKSYLLNEIFGENEDQSAFDHSEDADNAGEIEELKKEAAELKAIRESVGTPEFCKLLFTKVFTKDIERLRSVEDMWKTRTAPESLNYDKLLVKSANAIEHAKEILHDDQKIWTLEENLAVFNDSLERLSRRLQEARKLPASTGTAPVITFDKDDIDTLDFVTASANIRSHIFSIELKSRFDVKQMAGNIIPAIATTNAIVAGLCVLESFKVLKGDYQQAREVFLTPFAPARLLAPDRSREPNPECPVCGVFNANVVVDLEKTTLNDIVEGLLQERMGLGEREFVVNTDRGIVYDPDETDNLPKKLADLGIKPGTFITVTDDSDDDVMVNIVLSIEIGTFGPDEQPFKPSFTETPDIPRKPARPESIVPNGHGMNGASNGDGPVEVSQGHKRALSSGDGQPAKKQRLSEPSTADDDVVIVDDAGGAIVIDDD